MDPRRAHVGKSDTEHQQYHAFLRRQQAEDPTYDADEPDLTNVPQATDILESTERAPTRKPYNRERSPVLSKEQWVGIAVGIFLFVITSLIGLLAISLNREVGVMNERQDQIRSTAADSSTRLNAIERAVIELQLRFEILTENRTE